MSFGTILAITFGIVIVVLLIAVLLPPGPPKE